MVDVIFTYFLSPSVENENGSDVKIYSTDTYMGEISDFISLDGVGYIIQDYTEDVYYPEDAFEGDSVAW